MPTVVGGLSSGDDVQQAALPNRFVLPQSCQHWVPEQHGLRRIGLQVWPTLQSDVHQDRSSGAQALKRAEIPANAELTSEPAIRGRYVRCLAIEVPSQRDPWLRPPFPIRIGTGRKACVGCRLTTQRRHQPGTLRTTCVCSAKDRSDVEL